MRDEFAAVVDDGDVHGVSDFLSFSFAAGNDATNICESDHVSPRIGWPLSAWEANEAR
jgi:hypothetical protein